MISLLPTQPQPTSVSDSEAAARTASQPQVPLPRFGTPTKFVTEGFWANLKQFLTERPVKLRGDMHSPLMPETYGDGFLSLIHI